MEARRCMECYDKEASKYDQTRWFYETGYGGYREKKLLSVFCQGPQILNVACGTGRLLPFLASKGSIVVGIDVSKNMLNLAKGKTRACKVQLVKCDAQALPFRDKSFDEIVCSRAFKFFPHPKLALVEWFRLLRSRGKAILSLETSDPLWIRIGYFLKLRRMGSRFEWRYHANEVQLMLGNAGFTTIFVGCIFYFGKTVYQTVGKHLLPALSLLEFVDSHNKKGRNTMFVGIKT